jgi:hypothetical protein
MVMTERKPPLPSSGAALHFARLLVPDWVDVQGCVLRAMEYDPGLLEQGLRAANGNRVAVEAELNRVRLVDEVSDPDPEILAEVAEIVVAAWVATLRSAFPDRTFNVSVTDGGANVTAFSTSG